MLDQKEQEVVEAKPLGDDDIRAYFPNSKIIVYSDLSKYKDLEELLPKDKDFAFILLESSPNRGHWTALSRYNDGNTIEIFDSYGGRPDSQLRWNKESTNEKLGQGKKLLSEHLRNWKGNVVYNPIKYQSDGDDVNTCGRHVCYRIQNMLDGKDLDAYYVHMKDLKNNMGVDFDGVVANFIRV